MATTASSVTMKVVIVTGAGSGIGRAIALSYARLGHKVAIVDGNSSLMQKTLESMIEESPSKDPSLYLSLQVDLIVIAELDQIVQLTVQKFGTLHILINNAGLDTCIPISDERFMDSFKDTLQTNLIAPTRLSQLAVPHLKKTKGVIINISPVVDTTSGSTISQSISKAGLSMLSKSLANSLDGTGVRVVTVSPGPIDTTLNPNNSNGAPLTLLHRLGLPEEVANVVTFLTSDKASFINASTITVDGGFLTKSHGMFHPVDST